MEFNRELYINKLLTCKNNGKVKLITGINCVGKSYFLFEIFLNYLLNHGCDKKHIFKIDLMEHRSEKFQKTEELLLHINNNIIDNNNYYVLIDEIQLIDNFQLLLDNCSKFNNIDFYVTGSDTCFFSNKLCQECDKINIYPLTFKEFIQIYKGEVKNHLEEYLLYGGMPSVVFIKEEEMKMEYLKVMYEYTIFAKINEHYKINKFDVMKNLIDVVASNIRNKVNFTNICNFININNKEITKLSVRTYMKIINNYYLLKQVQSLNIKKMKNSYSPVKYYFTDLGMRNIRHGFNNLEKPILIENMIYNELLTRDYEVSTGFFSNHVKLPNGKFGRKHYDIDFVCLKNDEIIYIQYCPSPDKNKEDALMRILGKTRRIVITDETTPTYKNDNGIYMINLYDFLLNDNILNEL